MGNLLQNSCTFVNHIKLLLKTYMIDQGLESCSKTSILVAALVEALTGKANVNVLYLPDSIEITSLERLTL